MIEFLAGAAIGYIARAYFKAPIQEAWQRWRSGE